MSDWDYLHDMHIDGYSPAQVADAAACGYNPWEWQPIFEMDLPARHSPSAPDIPTVRESGISELKDVFMQSYYGFVGPAGMSPALARKIEADILRVAAMPDVKKRLEGAGMDMYMLDAQKMGTLVKTDIEKIRRVVKCGNIKAE